MPTLIVAPSADEDEILKGFEDIWQNLQKENTAWPLDAEGKRIVRQILLAGFVGGVHWQRMWEQAEAEKFIGNIELLMSTEGNG